MDPAKPAADIDAATSVNFRSKTDVDGTFIPSSRFSANRSQTHRVSRPKRKPFRNLLRSLSRTFVRRHDCCIIRSRHVDLQRENLMFPILYVKAHGNFGLLPVYQYRTNVLSRGLHSKRNYDVKTQKEREKKCPYFAWRHRSWIKSKIESGKKWWYPGVKEQRRQSYCCERIETSENFI